MQRDRPYRAAQRDNAAEGHAGALPGWLAIALAFTIAGLIASVVVLGEGRSCGRDGPFLMQPPHCTGLAKHATSAAVPAIDR